VKFGSTDQSINKVFKVNKKWYQLIVENRISDELLGDMKFLYNFNVDLMKATGLFLSGEKRLQQYFEINYWLYFP
jgi:hypothetical protein